MTTAFFERKATFSKNFLKTLKTYSEGPKNIQIIKKLRPFGVVLRKPKPRTLESDQNTPELQGYLCCQARKELSQTSEKHSEPEFFLIFLLLFNLEKRNKNSTDSFTHLIKGGPDKYPKMY